MGTPPVTRRVSELELPQRDSPRWGRFFVRTILNSEQY
jgi:hypothetical protein